MAGSVRATVSARSTQPQAIPDSPARAWVIAACQAMPAQALASSTEVPRTGSSSRRHSSVSVCAESHCPLSRRAWTMNHAACPTAARSPAARAVLNERSATRHTRLPSPW